MSERRYSKNSRSSGVEKNPPRELCDDDSKWLIYQWNAHCGIRCSHKGGFRGEQEKGVGVREVFLEQPRSEENGDRATISHADSRGALSPRGAKPYNEAERFHGFLLKYFARWRRKVGRIRMKSLPFLGKKNQVVGSSEALKNKKKSRNRPISNKVEKGNVRKILRIERDWFLGCGENRAEILFEK